MNRKHRGVLGWWLQLVPGCVFGSVALDHMPFAASFPLVLAMCAGAVLRDSAAVRA